MNNPERKGATMRKVNEYKIPGYKLHAYTYVWVVTDGLTKETWLFYDGEQARRFAQKIREKTEHPVSVDTQDVIEEA